VVSELVRQGLPVVSDGRPAGSLPVTAWVDNDHEAAVLGILDHLADAGARRIGLLTGTTTDTYTHLSTSAYLRWCERVGQDPVYEAYPAHDPCAGAVAADRLLARPDRPDAVYGLFDPSNFFGRCDKPVLLVSGTNDRGATTDELMQSYRAVPGPATLSVRVKPCHCSPQYVGACYEHVETPIFTDSVFRGSEPMVKVEPPRVEGRRITADFTTPVGAFTASAHWTDQLDRPPGERVWSSAFTEKSERSVTAEIGTDRPAIAFVTLVDQRGAMSSSEIVGMNGATVGAGT
jgi:hypothetical protein